MAWRVEISCYYVRYDDERIDLPMIISFDANWILIIREVRVCQSFWAEVDSRKAPRITRIIIVCLEEDGSILRQDELICVSAEINSGWFSLDFDDVTVGDSSLGEAHDLLNLEIMRIDRWCEGPMDVPARCSRFQVSNLTCQFTKLSYFADLCVQGRCWVRVVTKGLLIGEVVDETLIAGVCCQEDNGLKLDCWS